MRLKTLIILSVLFLLLPLSRTRPTSATGSIKIVELFSWQDSESIQFPELKGFYMGQKPPGDQPEMFLPGIVSGDYRAHSPIVFSPDGKEAYWTEMRPPDGAVMGMEMVGDVWTPPKISTIMRGEPSFSPDGKKLYFISLKPLREGEEGGKENIWCMEEIPSGWSEPKPVGDGVNSGDVHFHHSVDRGYNLYFSDYENMYYSQYKDGEYQKAVNIKKLFRNRTLKGNSPCISPDGDYLLFSAKRKWYDSSKCLFISFKSKDGTWTDRIFLGERINADRLNDSPRVTPDGKYIFFVSSGESRPWGIYWVSTNIIDTLRREHLTDN
ncbi:MAG: PD40 domain-containing protein [Fidelibacterota bacterium]|nr:MAG: PD40 domain-containing protein [Candidatus Neomarinimicrobiota bacterium]